MKDIDRPRARWRNYLPSLRSFVLSGLFWLVFAALWFVDTFVRVSSQVGAGHLPDMALSLVFVFGPYAVLTPCLLAVGRYAVRELQDRRSVLRLLGRTLVVVSTAHALGAVVYFPGPGAVGSVATAITAFVSSWMIQAMHYAAILGVGAVVAHATLSEERRRELLKAQLRVLRGQLEPHFLFNALHGVGVAARQDPETAARMVALLGDLLRRSLRDRDRDLVTVDEELDLLQPYLELQRLRFADRLKIDVDVADDVRAAAVPDLLLQPLVENALRHGIERRPDSGTVRIRMRRADDLLEIQIADDGAGLSAPPSLEHERIGLGATRARLDALFGSASALQLVDAIGGGTTVIVRFPFQELARAA